jgi:hypothetical protein
MLRSCGQVLSGAPELVQSGQLSHLAAFFAERLSDWKCVRGSLRGCLALLQRGQSSLEGLAQLQVGFGPVAPSSLPRQQTSSSTTYL